MAAFFALTAFLAAALLFLVEPMAAKMVLPALGGSAAVWTTCVLFFQAALLLGYAWAHGIARTLGPRVQVGAHALLLLAAAVVLPPAIAARGLPPVDSTPVPWLLAALSVAFGLPFVAIAATGPLVQRWFSITDHRRAHDPYFLYAASNAGSFAGLLAYPFLIEPRLPLRAAGIAHAARGGVSQAAAWSWGYVALGATVLVCGVIALRRAAPAAPAETHEAVPPVPWRERLFWVVLAAVPASAVVGATQFVSSDIAAVPLLWIVPLAIYLLTMVLAFARRWSPSPAVSGVAFAVLAVAAAAAMTGPGRKLGIAALAVHFAVLAALGLTCHGRLAQRRPDRAHLTEYFLWIAGGGVVGGAFNALVAPLIFATIAEYPIALVAAALLRPGVRDDGPRRAVAWLGDAGAAAAIFAVWSLTGHLTPTTPGAERWLPVLHVALPALLTAAVIGWPRRFAIALALLFALTWWDVYAPWTAIRRDRTFYGVHRVTTVDGPMIRATDPSGKPVWIGQKFHLLVDGVTRHGTQSMDPARSRTPTTYFHPSGPLGDIIRGLRARGTLRDVGVVGLGAGTIAAYSRPGERFTYFEIDPAVESIARDPRCFTYLAHAQGEVRVVLGDGRRRLAEQKDASFDLIVIDAFSSDSIPVHLLTREAVAMYLRKLKPTGLLALHITNHFLRLDPVVAAIASDLGVAAAVKRDTLLTPELAFEGKDLSKWAIVAARPGEALPVAGDSGWLAFRSDLAPADMARYLWTDNRSDVVGLLFAPY